MKEGLNSGEIQYCLPKIDIDNLSPVKILAEGLRAEELNPFIKKLAIDSVDQQKEKFDYREFNFRWDEESVFSNIRQRLDSYGLIGPLKNITLKEYLETDESKKVLFLQRQARSKKRAFIVSADYYSNDENIGRVHNFFYFNTVGVNYNKVMPSFNFSKYVQLPVCLSEKLHSSRRALWANNKNLFER